MKYIIDIVLTDLRSKVAQLGNRGGLMTASVYDTAQVLRLCPAPESGATVDWLLEQQAPDGGWGRPDVPLARHVPTLACVLALHADKRSNARASALRGIEFLALRSSDWRGPLPDDIPVGVELLFPKLLEEAEAAGIRVPSAPYEALMALGHRRRQLLATLPISARTQAIHTWEAWGGIPDRSLLSNTGGLGDSPTATASFWAKGQHVTELRDAVERARTYLDDASRATEEDRPGLVPTVWPINRFEQSFALYALCVAGLVEHSGLHGVVREQVSDLARALKPEGLASSDSFIPDGDDTAAAIVALRMTGQPVDLSPLKNFEEHGHFCTWPRELQPSISVNARAIHALSLFGEDAAGPRQFVLERQRADGAWDGDKWNSSWVYTTAHVLLALSAHRDGRSVSEAVNVLLGAQRHDGGWGGGTDASSVETAWCALALRNVRLPGVERQVIERSLRRALQFLLANYKPFQASALRWWLAKENYGTPRLDRTVELVAMLALALDQEAVAAG